MSYIIDFDIAAIFVNSIILFFYARKKKLPVLQNKIFTHLLQVVLFASAVNILRSLLAELRPSLPAAVYVAASRAYFLLLAAITLCFIVYCMAITDFFYINSRRRIILAKAALTVYNGVLAAVVLFSPIFTLDASLNCTAGGSWFLIFTVMVVCALVLAVVLLCMGKKRISNRHFVILVFYAAAVIAIMLSHYFFPARSYLFCFGTSIMTIMLFLYVQQQEGTVDSVTEVFTRNAFVRMLSHYFKKVPKFTCVSIVIDDMVFMSNTFGIGKMNVFMRQVADFLGAHFKPESIYYLSQGQFCLLLGNQSQKDVYSVIGLLQSRFQKKWTNDTIELKLYSRVCVTNCPADAKSAEEILDIISLVQNDTRYKESVVYASEIDVERKKRTLYIEHALRNALSENRFEVYYQPIYSTKEQRLVGAEALIRLRDENGEFISPEDFIPIAEKTGTILRIGEFVFESVCKTLSNINTREYGIKKIDINLSVEQCMQDILAEQILAIRSIYQVPSSIINLEITETAAAHTPEILYENMKKLSDAGIELSLDDYGSGYSNINYMLALPFKMIKIDKGIVWQAYKDDRANIALTSTIQMIRAMNMTVLAEGVETKSQADWLTTLGCDYLQGYYFAKPMPREEFLVVMKKDYLAHKDNVEEQPLPEPKNDSVIDDLVDEILNDR